MNKLITIKISKTNKEFIDDYKDYLLNNQEELQLFYLNLSNSVMIIDKPNIRGGVYINNKLSLIFLNPLPFNLQVKSLDNNLECFDSLCQYIIDNNIEINGVQGKLFDCQQFVNSYNLIKQQDFVINLSMDILSLKKVNDISTLGKIFIPTMEYYNQVKEIINLFFLEAINVQLEDSILEAKTTRMLKDNICFFHTNSNNEITSFVSTNKALPNGHRISMVYTYEKYRHMGYAKSMMYLVCDKLIKDSSFITLFVDKKNNISNKVYKDVGFTYVNENYEFLLKIS